MAAELILQNTDGAVQLTSLLQFQKSGIKLLSCISGEVAAKPIRFKADLKRKKLPNLNYTLKILFSSFGRECKIRNNV